MEYLCAEVVEIAGNIAKEAKRRRIFPRHLMMAMRTDDELHEVIKNQFKKN